MSVTRELEDPRGVQIADIDADGELDVVVGTRAAGEVVAWFGSPLGLPLQPEVVCVVEPGHESMELIDLDLDGDVDLLVALPGPSLVAHLNGGAGFFGPPVPLLQAPAGMMDWTLSFDVADVMGDARPEVVFSVSGAAGISDRSVFALSELLSGAPVRSLLMDAASPVYGVFTDDFDVDGDADLFLCLQDGATWYRNDGSFTLVGSAVLLPPGIGSDANFASGDFDGDGHLDIVSHAIGTFSTRLHVHRGDGTGQFAPPVDLNYNDRTAREIQLSDLDSDGDDDVVICGALGRPPLTIESFPGATPGPLTEALGGAGTSPSMDVADLDGDGQPEVVYATSAGALQLQRADLSSSALLLGDDVSPLTQTVSSVIASPVVDLDGDGNLDVLALEGTSGRLRWWRGDGAGNVGDWEAPLEVGQNPCGVEALDIDADGDMDLLFTVEFGNGLNLVENLGGGAFGPPTGIHGAADGSCDLDVVDLDGDGLVDVLRPQWSTDSLLWARNLGNGMLAPEQVLFAISPPWQSYALADREGDGDLDVLVDATQTQAGLSVMAWYINDGAAGFTGPVLALSSTNGLPGGFSQGILVEDFNGDGLPDLVQSLGRKGPPSGSLLSFMAGSTAGTFGTPQEIASSASWALWSPASSDVDGDGLPDVLVNSAALDWYRGRGDGTFDAKITLLEPVGFFFGTWFEGVDFDRDGDLDHVVAPGGPNALVRIETLALGELGTSFCDPAEPNSTGQPGTLSATGSAQAASNAVSLEATGLPPQELTLFLASRTRGRPVPVINSRGNLCLTGPIGRFNGPGPSQVVNAAGQSTLTMDTGRLPLPVGFTSAFAGEEWAFQVWYRDSVLGLPTFNFTNGVAVRFL